MASSSHIPPHDQNNNQLHNVNYISSCSSPSNNISNLDSNFTTFVRADPSNFRSVVQKLTGAASVSRHPIVGKSNSGEKGPRRSTFKLHERRHSARKLENILTGKILSPPPSNYRQLVMASPVSPLEMLKRGSPKSPMEELEERTIAEKGFYLHPSPLSTPRGTAPPELLPLFPLQSPTATDHSSS